MPRPALIGSFALWAVSGATLIGVAVMALARMSEPPRDEPVIDIMELAKPIDLPAPPDRTAFECMALAMYHEARSEPGLGLRAVGHVILNRVEDSRYPDDVCGVVKDGGETPPCQFSWWCDGRPDGPVYQGLYRRAEVVAYQLLTEPDEDPTDGALHFHSDYVSPFWADEFEMTVTIGRHSFYRP